MFTNNQIDIDSLPKVEEIDFKPIETRYFKIIIFNLIITYAGLISALTIVRFIARKKELFYNTIYWYILFILITLFVIQFLIYKLGFNKRQYAIRDKDIVFTKGLITNTLKALPFNRIQHIEVERSFLERKLNLSTLNVYSAGESGGDLSISGLPKETVTNINAHLTTILNERDRL